MEPGSRGWIALLWDVLILGWHSDSSFLLGLLLSVSATNISRLSAGQHIVNNMRAITRMSFLDTFIFWEANFHNTAPTLAWGSPRPSVLACVYESAGYDWMSKRKLGTQWWVPGTELLEMCITWRKSKSKQQEEPEYMIYEKRVKEGGMFSRENRWLWPSNTWQEWTNPFSVVMVDGRSSNRLKLHRGWFSLHIKQYFNTFLCLPSSLSCGVFLPGLLTN